MSGALPLRPGEPAGIPLHAGLAGRGGIAKSPPAEAVLAVGEGVSWAPAVAVLSVADVVASTVGFAVGGQLRCPFGRSSVNCSNWQRAIMQVRNMAAFQSMN